MAKKEYNEIDPVDTSHEDGSYDQLLTPLNAPKADPDPQAQLKNAVIPWSEDDKYHDPMGYLDLTGPSGRRGDPKKQKGRGN